MSKPKQRNSVLVGTLGKVWFDMNACLMLFVIAEPSPAGTAAVPADSAALALLIHIARLLLQLPGSEMTQIPAVFSCLTLN